MKIEIEIPDDFVPKIQPLYQKILRLALRNPPEYLEWDEIEEARMIHYDVMNNTPNPELGMLSIIVQMTDREFAKGVRCRVCGMTKEQSAAIGYNCSEEC